MSRFRFTQWCAFLAVAALAATSCSGSDDGANPGNSPDTGGLARVDEATTSTTVLDLPQSLGTPLRSEGSDQIVFSIPEHRIVSDGGSVREIDGTENELVLATVSPLEVGTNPDEGERFGRIDVGPGRLILAELSAPGQATSIVAITSAGTTTIGHGTHPGVDPSGRFFVFVDDDADSAEAVLTQRDLDGSVLGSYVAAGPILDVAVDPAGGRIGVLHEVGRSAALTIVAADSSGLVEQNSVAVSGDTRHISFVGPSLVALASSANGSTNVSIIDVFQGSIVSQFGLESGVIDLDWSASGDVGLAVIADGSVVWLAGGASGQLAGAGVVGGRW